MKKQVWFQTCVVLLCFVLFIPSTGLTESSISDGLLEFQNAVVDKQNQTSFLVMWDDKGKQQFIELLYEHEICAPSSQLNQLSATWHTPSHGLQYAFEQVWGSKLYWTLQQNYEYAHFEIECGVSTSTIVALPTEGDMPVDKARAYVQEAIRDKAIEKRPGFDGNFMAYIERVQFWNYPEYGPVWVFEYHVTNSITPEFSGMIYLDTLNITVDIYDNLDMQYLYRQKYFENGFQPYHCWSLDDQAAFYRQLVALKEQQLMVYGFIPSFAETILTYEHILPSDNMLPMAEAQMFARERVSRYLNEGTAAANISFSGVSLIRITDDRAAYCFYFEAYDNVQEIIAVDAYTGNIIELDSSLKYK